MLLWHYCIFTQCIPTHSSLLHTIDSHFLCNGCIFKNCSKGNFSTYSPCCFWHAVMIFNTRCLPGFTKQCKHCRASSLLHCIWSLHSWQTHGQCNRFSLVIWKHRHTCLVELIVVTVKDMVRWRTLPLYSRDYQMDYMSGLWLVWLCNSPVHKW